MDKINQLDVINRERALNPTQSFIIQAPAGSGKTELLIQRFLVLLTTVNHPEEILAITFTKKAANEMRERIISTLKEAAKNNIILSEHKKKTHALAKSVLARDEQLSWHLLQNPNQLRVQTIDSLCSYLTRNLPLISHFGAQPGIAENATTLYQEAVEETLQLLEQTNDWTEAIKQLLRHLDNRLDKLSALLCSLLGRRDQWLQYIMPAQDESALRQLLEKNIQQVVAQQIALLNDCFPQCQMKELLSITYYAAQNLDRKELLSCLVNNKLPADSLNILYVWKFVAEILLTKTTGKFRKKADKSIGFPALSEFNDISEKKSHFEIRERYQQLLKNLIGNENLETLLGKMLSAPLPVYEEDQWQTLYSLLSILKLLTAQLRIVFQKYGQIDFIENAQAAIFALGTEDQPTNLTLALDYQIKHILIDEFQDTSYSQYQLLSKLTMGWTNEESKSLFIVGDPMQSIYRFRQAEVGIFLNLFSGQFNQLTLIPLKLFFNFRSLPDIVNWNNKIFSNVFPEHANTIYGAVPHTASLSPQHINQLATSQVNINHFFHDNGGDEGRDIAQNIQQLLIDFPNEKIAILVRARNHLIDIIPHLQKANIPYSAVQIDPLINKQIIQDLLSLTAALLSVANKLAWMSLLRAPCIGLTLTDLMHLSDAHRTVWEQINCKETLQRLSQDAQQRLNKILPLLQTKIAQYGRLPLRAWIESTWLSLGGPASLNHVVELEDVEIFFSMLEQVEREETFITYDLLVTRLNRIFAHSEANSPVQIMTIHNAKGLEFDTVFIPHLEKQSPHEDKALLNWVEYPLSADNMALLLAPLHGIGMEKNRLYEYIYNHHKLKSDYEMDRLLYVAATRAAKRLFLSFTLKLDDNQNPIISKTSFLKKIWSLITIDPIENKLRELIKNSLPTDERKLFKRIASEWESPIQPTFQEHDQHQFLNRKQFLMKDPTPAIIGTVTHECLELIGNEGTTWWISCKESERKSFLNTQLKILGCPISHLNAALDLITEMINDFLLNAKGQWIIHSHEEAVSELSLTAYYQNKVQQIIIDRTFVENGKRWIIDYKTSAANQEDAQAFIRNEIKTYQEKMQLYQQIFQLKEHRPIHMGFYFLRLEKWVEL